MRIVAGLDLSVETHDWLFRRAVTFAEAVGGRLDLVYAADDEQHLPRLHELVESIPEAHRGEPLLRSGVPADVLVELSREADALVVGPRPPQGFERWVLDPVSVRELRRSRCPVYIPRTDKLGDRKPRLRVGLDLGSDRLEFVLDSAVRWAESLGAAEVDVVYAIPRSLPAIRRPELRAAAEREWAALHAPEQETLAGLLERFPVDRRGEASIAHGEPEDVLTHDADHYDLIMVGNRARRGLQGLILGSVAKQVVLRARCDVLVLPTASAHEIDRAD